MSGFANSISNAVNQIAYSNPVSSIIDTGNGLCARRFRC